MNIPMKRRLVLVHGVFLGLLVASGLASASFAASATTTTTSTTMSRPTTTSSTSTSTTRPEGFFEVSASPTSELVAGTVINVTVNGGGGSVVTHATAQICQNGRCATEPPTPDSDAIVRLSPGPSPSPFRVGVGTFRGTANGAPFSFTCGPADPCQLVVTATTRAVPQSPRAFGLTYADTTPTTTLSTTTTIRPITTTSRPATTTTVNPRCAWRDDVPPWLWAILVRWFAVAC
jgi:hypothetical protein